MINTLTFFSRNKKSGELKVGDRNRRNVIITLIENNELTSITQLSNKSQVPYSDTKAIIDDFVKCQLVSPFEVAKFKGRTDYKYELTKIGIMYGLAIKYDEKLPIGEKRRDFLLKVFQSDRGIAPINHFMFTVMINAINRNLEDYVLRFIRKIIEIAESSSDPNLWSIAEKGVAEAKSLELQKVGEAVIQALDSLSQDDKRIVVQYFRNMTINKLFEGSIFHGNTKLQKLLTMSQEDKEGIFREFRCRCGYMKEDLYMTMEEIIIQVFTGGLECPRCGRLVKNDPRINKKGFRNHKIQVYTK